VLTAVMAVIERQAFIMGAEVGQLEAEIARLSHAKHGIACASGTDALLLPLKALDLKPGDEVITTPFTFFATAGTIHNAGGTPVFVDIDSATMNIDPRAIEAAVTPRTRAIIVVHLFGQMAAMEEIGSIAARHQLPVIEDGAQSIGARRRIDGVWRMSGELGTVGTLSFFPTKNLGAWGDGGLIVTQDDALAERLRRLRLHGGSRQYLHEEIGTNSRLDTLQAAVLLAKLPHLERWNQARKRNAARYQDAFRGHPAVCPPAVDPANDHIFHQYTIRVPQRDRLQAHLKERGIGHSVYYPLALHLQPCFAFLGYRRGSLPVAEAAMDSVISLPIYPEMTAEQQDAVIQAVQSFYD
jgi:dTDP-4-amino-4,6-dideoxygalactose transaminase